MKLSVFGLGVAFALASLTMPGIAADSRTNTETRSSNGFSSSRSESKPSTPPPRAESRPDPKPFVAQPQPTPRRESGGFSSDRPAVVDPPRANGGFTATPRERDTSPPPVVNRVAPQEPPRTSGGFSSSPPVANSPPPLAQQPAQPTGRTANGFSSNSTKPDNSAVATPRVQQPAAPPSAVDRLSARSTSQDAFRQFKKDQNAYKTPEVAPVNQQAAQSSTAWKNYGTGWKSPDDYYKSRNNAFSRDPGFQHYYSEPPSWVQSRPNYGAYAAAFLGGIVLDRIMTPSYANWAYSHQNDPDVQQWHREMMEQARDNAELREKMAAYDRKIAELQANNAPKTEALPPDVDPSLVVAPSTAIVATTAEPSSGHPILWTLFIVFLVAIAFIAACVFISQRKRNRFA